MAEFPSGFSFFFRTLFRSPEGPFKEYVTAVCTERGYSSDIVRTLTGAYGGFGKSSTGDLNFHLDNIYREISPSISGYRSAKSWAMSAADKICPDKNGPTRGSGSRTVTGLYRPAEVSTGRRVLHYSIVDGLQILLGLRRRVGYQNVSVRSMIQRGYYNFHAPLGFARIPLYRQPMCYARP